MSETSNDGAPNVLMSFPFRTNLALYFHASSILRPYDVIAEDPLRPDPGRGEKINLNFYFHTSLWDLRFFEYLKGLHKTFCGTSKKCKNKNLS